MRVTWINALHGPPTTSSKTWSYRNLMILTVNLLLSHFMRILGDTFVIKIFGGGQHEF